MIQAGRVRPLGVTSPKRAALLPNVPAISEAVPGYQMIGWYSLVAPAASPPDVLNKVSAEVVKAVKEPEFGEKLKGLGTRDRRQLARGARCVPARPDEADRRDGQSLRRGPQIERTHMPLETITWKEKGETRSAQWRSESGTPPPQRVVVADDRMTADAAYRLACEGTAILWRGDFQNARQLLIALAKRTDKKPKKPPPAPASQVEAFHLHRQAQSQRARTLGMLLLPFDADHTVPLRRAPDVRQACAEAYGPAKERYVASMRELLGVIGAHEWRKKGIEIPAAGGRIHPYYGVFAPVRNEYVDLVAEAPLPSIQLAFDIGTGTGVLAAVLAKRGVERVVATEHEIRALSCARANVARLKLTEKVEVVQADLFRKDALRSSSATRRGSPRGRALPSSTRSTTSKAACCADSSAGSRRTSSRAGKGGSCFRTSPSTWACARVTSFSR